ncbi:MAG TPA: methionine synthase [Jatrophihabitantaceae bacterium]|nr:methionine synthase [Jatrophihabitantaceae bacterium]
MTRPWERGAATGIGSLPGTDPVEAARLVFGELPDLPHLPELPARGSGADMIGRGAALLVDLPVEIVPTGWRLAAHRGRDQRRAEDYLARDVDALHEQADGYTGALKVQVAGPWTLAANLELPTGHRVVTDHGAVRDLAESLAEGIRAHVADLRRRVPGASPVVQLDEPSLPAVLAGELSTPSGWGTVRAIAAPDATRVLQTVLDTIPSGGRVVHCCAPNPPLDLLRDAGANAIAVDAALLRSTQYDALGAAVDAGVSLWLGVLPATDTAITLDTARDPLLRLWRELGFAESALADAVVPTPACGLAGANAAYVRRALSVLRDAGRALRELG